MLSLSATLLLASRVYPSIQEVMLEHSLTIISTCLPGAITEHFYIPPLPPEIFNSPGKGRPRQGLPTYALTGVTYLCAKPNTLLLKTGWMVTEKAAPHGSPVQNEA